MAPRVHSDLRGTDGDTGLKILMYHRLSAYNEALLQYAAACVQLAIKNGDPNARVDYADLEVLAQQAQTAVDEFMAS